MDQRDTTRERLVRAAAEVFSEKGYDRAGVQEIARRAGLTTGAIYSRYTGKAELLLEAIQSTSNDEFDALFADHRFEQRATDLLTTVGSHLVSRETGRGEGLLLEAFVAARRDPEVAALLRQQVDERAGRVAELVRSAKANGGIDAELDTFSIVRFCHAVGLGFLLFEALDSEMPDAEPWEDLIKRLVEALGPAEGES
jgi:AcrR family transcriptional regulator